MQSSENMRFHGRHFSHLGAVTHRDSIHCRFMFCGNAEVCSRVLWRKVVQNVMSFFRKKTQVHFVYHGGMVARKWQYAARLGVVRPGSLM